MSATCSSDWYLYTFEDYSLPMQHCVCITVKKSQYALLQMQRSEIPEEIFVCPVCCTGIAVNSFQFYIVKNARAGTIHRGWDNRLWNVKISTLVMSVTPCSLYVETIIKLWAHQEIYIDCIIKSSSISLFYDASMHPYIPLCLQSMCMFVDVTMYCIKL